MILVWQLIAVISHRAGTSSRAQAPAPQSATPRFFGGGGNTLGSEDAPSVVVPDPSARPARTSGMPGGLGGQDEDDEEDMDDQEVATRILTFWSNGFSIEDGMRHFIRIALATHSIVMQCQDHFKATMTQLAKRFLNRSIAALHL